MKVVINNPNDVAKSGSIEFVYDATGTKLRKTVKNKNDSVKETWDYVNGVEYKNQILQRVAHSEGAVVRNDFGQYQHEYVLRDHLGNTRVTFRDGENRGFESGWGRTAVPDPGYDDGIVTKEDIVQINNYYPFGLNMEGDWNGAQGRNKYQYNGKEWNDDFGLGWNDYGARFYDPSIARWSAVDLLSEKYLRWSPYNYCADNPVKFIDPNGMNLYLKNGNTEAFMDLIATAYESMKNGSLTLNFTKGEKYTQVTGKVGKGANAQGKLIGKLMGSSKNYLYEVSATVAGKNISGDMPKDAINLSKTPRGDDADAARRSAAEVKHWSDKSNGEMTQEFKNKMAAENALNYSLMNQAPEDDFFDAHILVKPFGSTPSEKEIFIGNKKGVSRSYFFFHEAAEAYFRTEAGMGLLPAHAQVVDKVDPLFQEPSVDSPLLIQLTNKMMPK
jgi:RHS repeat-associated protein